MTPRALAPLALAFALACGDNQDPRGADAFWQQIHATNYRAFPRAPGYEARRPSRAPHGKDVEIFVDPRTADAIARADATAEWPVGTLIVKDGYDGDRLVLVAAMEKRTDGWYWAEWSAEGAAKYSGKPGICTDCHAGGADFVRAFPLPGR